MTGVESRAFGEAQRLEQSWTGAEHLLLALLPELPWLDLDAAAVRERLLAMNVKSERPFDGSTTSTSRYAQICGWAYAWAAAQGVKTPAPEHWLLGILYVGDGIPASLLREAGFAPKALVGKLRERGVATPAFDPPED